MRRRLRSLINKYLMKPGTEPCPHCGSRMTRIYQGVLYCFDCGR